MPKGDCMGSRISSLAGWAISVAVATAWPIPIRAEAPSEPKLEIALHANSIVANGSIPGKLWLANSSAQPLAGATLHFDGPTPLQLTAVVCTESSGAEPPFDESSPDNGPKTGPGQRLRPTAASEKPREIPATAGRFALGAVGPTAALSCDFSVRADSEVQEGDFRALFTVVYEWETPDGARATSFVLAKERITVGVFGTDSIGGVSLRLAAYVIPGLLFLMVLRLGWARLSYTDPIASKTKGHGAQERSREALALTAPEAATLSVVGSVLLTTAASWCVPTTLERGMSPQRFLTLCLIAVAIALAIPVGNRAYRWWRASRSLITTEEFDHQRYPAILYKALASGLWSAAEPVAVELVSGKELVGSTIGRMTGRLVLIGWFRLVPKDRGEELEALEARGKLARLAKIAEKQGLTVTPRPDGSIRERGADGPEPIFKEMEQLRWRDVASIHPAADPGLKLAGTLIVDQGPDAQGGRR